MPFVFRKAGCACGGSCPSCRNTAATHGLPVSQPGDPLEIEADRIADRVMRMPQQPHNPGESEAHKNPKPQRGPGMVLRSAKPNAVRPSSDKPTGVGTGAPLSGSLRQFFEPRFQTDFSRVRVHDGSRAHAMADQYQARAYTLGSHIVFNRGEYQPQTLTGRRLLAHELTHVVQQDGGSRAENIHRAPGHIQRNAARARAARSASRVCTATERGKLQSAVNVAQNQLSLAVAGIDDLMGNWGNSPAHPLQIATMHALTGGFRILSDRSVWPMMGIATAAEVLRLNQRDLAHARTVRSRFLQLETDLRTYLSLPSCHNTAGACFGCLPPTFQRCTRTNPPMAFVGWIGQPNGGVYFCPGFYSLNDLGRGEALIHELSHISGFATSDRFNGVSYYGCPVQPIGTIPRGHTPPASATDLMGIAASYNCFIKLQNQYLRLPNTISASVAPQSSALPANVTNAWAIELILGNNRGALDIVVRAMIARGEIDTNLIATRAVPTSTRPQCRSADLIQLDRTMRGALTLSCGCFGTAPNRKPNPRIVLNPALIGNTSTAPTSLPQLGAETLHATLRHEYRHIQQLFASCNQTGPLSGGRGLCTDCNHPAEMDAYLSELESGYSSREMRHAWVRVFVNWDFLGPEQQAQFAGRRRLAEQRINRRYPRVNWSTDPEVIRTRAFCRTLPDQGAPGACDSPLAPADRVRQSMDELRRQHPDLFQAPTATGGGGS